MDRFANPYSPGAGTAPPALVGRERLFDQCRLALGRVLAGNSAKGQMVTGLRGVGKTVLLNAYEEMAAGAGYETTMIEAADNAAFLATLARELRRTVVRLERRGPLSAIMKQALGVFKSFTITAGLDGSIGLGLEIEPERGLADSGDAELDLRDLFVALGKAALERGTGIFVAIDELQYVSQLQLGALIGAVHRTAQQRLPILVSGAGLPNLPALAGEAKTYAERLFDFTEIASLTPEQVAEAVTQPAARLGVSFSEEAIAEIVEITHGYPYFVQEWAHDTWDIGKTSPLTADDVAAATAIVIRRLDDSFFRVRFERLTPVEQQYLRAMAELGEGPQRSGEIARAYGTTVQRAAPIREALITKGMIYSPAHGQTAYTVPLFDRYMKRVLPILSALQKAR